MTDRDVGDDQAWCALVYVALIGAIIPRARTSCEQSRKRAGPDLVGTWRVDSRCEEWSSACGVIYAVWDSCSLCPLWSFTGLQRRRSQGCGTRLLGVRADEMEVETGRRRGQR